MHLNQETHVVAEDRCLLAVVGGREEQAGEVVACFARQGERVAVRWYPDVRNFLATEGKPDFGAVILFASASGKAGEAEEVALRGVLSGVPLYRM